MCYAPIIVREGKTDEAKVPCGKCPACRSRRASAWSFRLMQHDKAQEEGHFVTLTYNNEHVPIIRNRHPMTLSYQDLQKFFKRLRKHESKTSSRKISYYAVGEYGTNNKRPHYHIILFNATVDNILRSWRNESGREIGSVHFGKIAEASVGYTLKYISKPKTIPAYYKDGRTPERSLMSKGIGVNYLSRSMLNWHITNGDNGIYCSTSGGKKIAMPRFYRERIGYDAEIFEQSAANYLNRIRDTERKEELRLGTERYHQQKAIRIKAAYEKMLSPEKSKKL